MCISVAMKEVVTEEGLEVDTAVVGATGGAETGTSDHHLPVIGAVGLDEMNIGKVDILTSERVQEFMKSLKSK